jgi:diguanylate cyclase (GGDEF)-like protein
MKSVKLFVRGKHNKIDQKKLQLQRSNNRSTKVIVSPYSQATLYLAIDSPTQLRSSVTLYSAETYVEENSRLQFQQGISIGGLLCLSIAFLLLFLATGNKIIFILSGYFFSNTLMLSAMLGYNLYYLLPQLPELIGIEIPLLTSISSIFLLVFTSQLFNLKARFYNIYQVIRVYFWGLLLYMPLSIQLSVADNVGISMSIYAFVVLSLIVLGIYLHKKSSRLALLFTLVMIVQLVFVLVVVGSVNWFDIGFVSYRSAFYGILFWLNSLLVTFILSRQYGYHVKDKQEAQRQALTNAVASERAQEELLRLQSQSQEELENRVQERTLELNIALQELEEVNRELEQKNTLDELTGLFNRRFYDQKILAEYRRSKRNLTPLSLVLIDIDHFKTVNDTYGHLAGDSCLEWLSENIKQSLKRSSDMAFRYGGEEFCLLLPDTDGKGAMALAEGLRERVANLTFTYKEASIQLTISNGIFTYLQQDNVMTEQIFANADKALYQAKHDGRNQTKACFE